MNTLNIDLGERSYPIYIGQGLLNDRALFTPAIRGQRVFVISNEVVAPLYLDTLTTTLSNAGDYTINSLVLPDGEATKSMDTINAVMTAMLEQHCDRQTTVIALGGGVTGDLTGFSAACYQRGVPFIQVPTTLLSQVDSSVGGKTGVNHPLGKNMIGAFYQPQAVIIDLNTLHTLNDRELSAGIAEVVKYGILGDRTFFEWLEANMDALLAREPTALSYAIERSCQMKAEIVAADEREGGVRALLNLGHTFGHAIENAKGYGEWLHGEAVALGMVMAADLSHRLGLVDASVTPRIAALLARAHLPVETVEGVGIEQMRALMSIDKKVLNGTLRLVLLQSLGKAFVTADFDEASLGETLAAFSD